jgi:hypothetical protein
MQIRYLSIRNFRGIKELDWAPKAPVNCLIGPGDSTKTTILDSIELALYPHWTIALDDSDFYNGDITSPIEIIVSVSNLPAEFFSDNLFGGHLRGWNLSERKIVDEPTPSCLDEELIISVKLLVDESLDPEWSVFNERLDDKIIISHKRRQNLGATRIGPEINRHLTWGRDSALSKLSDNIKDAGKVLIDANRLVRDRVTFSDLPGLKMAIEKVSESSIQFGIKPVKEFKPNLDAKSISFGFGSISLFDGEVPLRSFGLGTRKLLTTSLQINNTTDGAIILIDEIEYGLEPYRIRNFLRNIESRIDKGHAIFTSHSPVTLVELDAVDLTIVRNIDGKTICLEPHPSLNGTVRRTPEALLSKRVIVCEGATEYGFLIALEDYWIKRYELPPFAYNGVSTVDGHGATFEEIVINLKSLMYDTAAFIDSDVKGIELKMNNLSENGITVFHWDLGKCFEDQVAHELPWHGLERLLHAAADIGDMPLSSVYESIRSRVNDKTSCAEDNLTSWLDKWIPEKEIRLAIGTSASKNGWFKSVKKGIALGEIICDLYDEIEVGRLKTVIEGLKKWVHD